MAGRRNQVRKQCVQNMLEAQIIEKKQHIDAFGLGKITASGCMSALEQIFGLCNAAMWLGLLRYLASPAAAQQTAPVDISDQSRASVAALLGSA